MSPRLSSHEADTTVSNADGKAKSEALSSLVSLALLPHSEQYTLTR